MLRRTGQKGLTDMERKALVLDIDGTLTNSNKEISPATGAGIRKVLESGHLVVLASGRPAYGMRRYAGELELKKYGGYLLSHNGARIVACGTGEVVYQKAVPGDLLPVLYEFAQKHDCGLATHSEDTVISAFAPDQYVTLEAHINDMPIMQPEDFVEYVNFPVYKCFMTAEAERAAMLEKKLQERCGTRAAAGRSEPFFIEIVSASVDKGDSLGKLMEMLGIKRENVICCGDGFNDLSMIRYAGLGVAMGNAQPVLKEAADYVTAGNDEDGVAEVIRKFILKE
ncbi:Cof-type HAD-IIB family hydrolase [Acetatifactor muris]|uniref:Cof-type HAD-IIB family hydrolase n=1 Tax=Acetatifactor muris TaxID=879566 RepID=UPI0023F13ABE|nr:Cof-type HAD-IIB family hydrolase [Acetatifactor muris]